MAAAGSTWAAALGEDEADKVLQLYSDDAVLWGTLSPTLRADRSASRLRLLNIRVFRQSGPIANMGERYVRSVESRSILAEPHGL